MNPSELSVALLAGFVSFLALCVLPLVPGYLSAVSAVEANRLGDRGTARRVVVATDRRRRSITPTHPLATIPPVGSR